MGLKSKLLVLSLAIMPIMAVAAERSGARVGVTRASLAAARSPNISTNLKGNTTNAAPTASPTMTTSTPAATATATPVAAAVAEPVLTTAESSGDCRDAYRACMDEFCLLDESEGYRCACSDNIHQSKSLIKEIQQIQEEAEKLYSEGVEREQLGAKAKLVFGESEAAQKSSRASGLSFKQWLASDGDVDAELGDDGDIGSGLYSMAADFCASELKACGSKAEMEEMLYSRMVVQDCKTFSTYLADQKSNANQNKRTAEAAVRSARLSMLDTTNKYNRGECLLAYRSCIADKGGCGSNFENCLDEGLLNRRANACENVLDQCMAVRSEVLKDWKDESESILAEAAKYADKNMRLTCLAQIQDCLEEGCSTSTNSACLTDVKVAAGICPIITECNAKVPGLQTAINDKLKYLGTRFCQNDVDKCLREKCGENFTAPECIGKKTSDIVAMCPQNMFPSCKSEKQFDIIVSSILLQMDYQMLQGCANHFGEQLGRVCGTDMSCLPSDDTVMGLTAVPETESAMVALRQQVRENSKAAVDEFMKQFEKDKTIAACADVEKPAGRTKLGASVFNTAKLIAEIGAENRAMRELETKIAELSRKQDVEKARKNCETTYKVETPEEGKKNYSYIRSVSFEPSLRNCHICRMQQVCETGGESKGAAMMKGAAGGLSSGAAAGTMVNAGWGTAIGSVVGAVGGALLGAKSGGKEEYCQEVESCEDVNM
ncbi:glycine zipper family protein [bacterium]|nr:glycine zipper family protein [bacterium]